MLFNSYEFAVFFAIVLALYWSMPDRWRIPFLLGASYFFYGSWDYRFLSLLMLSTVIDYTAGLLIERSDDPRRRRLYLLCSLGSNLGILGFFKYCNFFVDSMRALLAALGVSIHTGTLDIILPVGISFYTFQTMSYTIDVYRRQVRPTRDFLAFATYVSFFPQLVAGPIERYGSLYPQLATPRRANVEFFRMGVFLVLQGYLKKVVIADNVAAVVDHVFTHPAGLSAGQLLEASILFTTQIYCDFSGYSDIARGVAYFLGVELCVNFRAPLLSRSITEFWRRWHVSLSFWLRDYLYIPLGGNRQGRRRTYVNLMTTMLLGGLWHGASWKFVAWGGLHGAALAVERMAGVRAREGEPPRPGDLWRSVLLLPATFAFVVVAFIFFRAASIGSGWQIVRGILGGAGLLDVGTFRLAAVLATIAVLDAPLYRLDDQVWALRLPLLVRLALYSLLLLALVLLTGHNQAPFIYFAF